MPTETLETLEIRRKSLECELLAASIEKTKQRAELLKAQIRHIIAEASRIEKEVAKA